MFSSQYHVFHSSQFCQNSDVFRRKSTWVKRLRQIVDKPVQIILRSACHGVADHDAQLAIKAKVDKHSKSSIFQPFKTLRFV